MQIWGRVGTVSNRRSAMRCVPPHDPTRKNSCSMNYDWFIYLLHHSLVFGLICLAGKWNVNDWLIDLKCTKFEGILIYEMLAGYPPFFDDNPFGIYEKILAGKIDWPRHMDPIAKDLVKKLLVQDRTKRLGNMKVSYTVARRLDFSDCNSCDWLSLGRTELMTSSATAGSKASTGRTSFTGN